MGQHIDQRSFKKKKLNERDQLDRRNRASFKQYLHELEANLEEDLLKEDLRHPFNDFDSDVTQD